MSEFYQIINSYADNKLIVFILSGIFGYLVNLSYSFYGFKWVDNINQKIISLIMAPAMTVIAWTIAGNLGLSLGMIGALSIVRFRTPIKSSLELIIYFIYIVIGISITVAPVYTLLIFILTIIAPAIFIFFKRDKNTNLEYIDTYMNEMPSANFVVTGNTKNLFDENISKKITHFKTDDDENNSTFTLRVENINDFNYVKDELENKVKIISAEYISW